MPDGPAIWHNKLNPEKSIIIGTNKKWGLYLYNLIGKELQFIKLGLINNVDVAYNFTFNNQTFDIVAAAKFRTKLVLSVT